jgi:glycosyltransferase involved in cell wall biosynthesis
VSNAAAPPLLVFADDWGRHPSSCQHLVRQLLGRHAVYWVNTVGTRTPRLNVATITRGWEKLRQWGRKPAGPQSLPANLRVWNPKMWPWFSSGFHRKLNRRLLSAQLGSRLKDLPAPPIAVTTLPIVADVMDCLPVRRWVYYCVDDFGQWPGLDQAAMQRLERDVVRRADVVVAASESLRQRLAGMGREAHLLTHGVDLGFWQGAANASVPAGLEGLERPLVVFFGLIDRRMDVTFVRRLAAELAPGSIVLAGPEADPDPALRATRRVFHLGTLPFEQLPALAREASVLIMPYADLPVTQAMQPLKLKEYMATGKPVVVRDLPANREWADCLDLADSPDAFCRSVTSRLRTELPEEQKNARRRLTHESWSAKARFFEECFLEADHDRKNNVGWLRGSSPGALPQAFADAGTTGHSSRNGSG